MNSFLSWSFYQILWIINRLINEVLTIAVSLSPSPYKSWVGTINSIFCVWRSVLHVSHITVIRNHWSTLWYTFYSWKFSYMTLHSRSSTHLHTDTRIVYHFAVSLSISLFLHLALSHFINIFFCSIARFIASVKM